MRVLIFGFGRIAKREYLPHLRRLVKELKPPTKLNMQCVDKGKEVCFEVETWEREPSVRLEKIDKVLILSPPAAHYQDVSAIARRCVAQGISFPEIYIEKPIYLVSRLWLWKKLLAKHAGLEDRVFYIDHYRFKDALAWFLERKSDILGSLGTIEEIGFVSLEKERFWDSPAFSRGYLLEHGCHLVSMLDRIFPGIEEREWVPQRPREWRTWEQAGRPESCRRDSACLAFLTLAGKESPEVSADASLTVVIGKGMIDTKVLYLRGERGACQIWFNQGRFVVSATGQKPTEAKIPSGQSYAAVVESIVSAGERPGLLLPLKQGMAEQEKVIAIQKRLPSRAETYVVGDVPPEIAKELVRVGLQSKATRGS